MENYNDEKTQPKTKKGINVKSHTINICEVALFCSLLIVSGFIKVPIPPVPFTLQTLICILAGGLLGKWKGLLSVGLYLFLGLVGLPIFTMGGGFFYVLTPTFGYLIAMLFGAFFTGWFFEKKRSYIISAIYCFAICIFMLFVGTLYLYMILNTNTAGGATFVSCLYSGFALFIIPELCKSLLGGIIIIKTRPILQKMIL